MFEYKETKGKNGQTLIEGTLSLPGFPPIQQSFIVPPGHEPGDILKSYRKLLADSIGSVAGQCLQSAILNYITEETK